MHSTVRSVASKVLKLFFGQSITSKRFSGTNSKLYYEKGQHLFFAFRSSISYEPVLQSKAIDYINQSDLIFDIGGNIGQYMLLFSHLAGPTGKVVTLELDSKNFSFLQFNCAINGLSNVVCLKKGVGRSITLMEFYRDSETGGRKGSFNRQFVEGNYKGHKEIVETVTIDTLIDQYGVPAFIKIDVEGFEAEVVAGLTKELPHTTFFVEVRKETQKPIFNYFQQRGYACFHIDKDNDVKVLDSNHIPGFANLLFKKP